MNCVCGNPVMGKRDKCRPCFMRAMNDDPAHKAKRAAANAARWARPGEREKQALLCRRNVQKRDAKPGMRAKYVELGKRHRANLIRPEVIAKTYSPECHAKRLASYIEARLGWCPKEYREAYHALSRSRGISATEAKRMILAQIVTDRARETAGLSPFERQQRALERGGKIVANDAAPSLSNPADYGERKWA